MKEKDYWEDIHSLDNLYLWQLEYLHKAITSYMSSDEGYGDGFHNKDLGHPVYFGISEDNSMGEKYGGEPHTNKVYMLLKQIENKIFSSVPDREEYFQEGDHCIEPFENWQNFCKYCQEVYKTRSL